MTSDLGVTLADLVATVELRRPPANHFDLELLSALADTCAELDENRACRSIVLCSAGKHFCAGADFGDSATVRAPADAGRLFYAQAARVLRSRTPMVAAVQGAAIGGGLGLALAADFRVATPQSRFAANFSMLGLHPGFAVSLTLPRVVGGQRALELLLTGRRIDGRHAADIGLVDRLVAADPRPAAYELATELARAAPLAAVSIRATMRADLLIALDEALSHELAEQDRLRDSDDFAEGVAASLERRAPSFRGE